MANPDTITQAIRHILTAYPKERSKLGQEEIRSMFEVWPQYLNDLDDTLLLAAVQEHITHSQWLPSIAELRASAVSIMRQASPAHQSAIDAWGEVKRAFLRVGYDGKPEFTNPITAKVIRLMGWRDLCLSDAPEGVDRAQFERYYNEEIRRAEAQAQQSPQVAAFVASMDANRFAALPEPNGTNGIVASIAKRLNAADD